MVARGRWRWSRKEGGGAARAFPSGRETCDHRRVPDRIEEPAHDVLAAEAFAVPAADRSLHHHPVVLPEDPTGIGEPHDVLAAEEFPMPAGRPGPSGGVADRRRPLAAALLALAGIVVIRRLRRR